MTTRTRLLLAAAILLGAAFLFLRPSSQPEAPRPTSSSPPPASRTDNASAASDTLRDRGSSPREGRRPPKPARLAPSLRGTDVLGGLLVDEDGNFIASADAIAMFEYFFSTSGEATQEEIVARIRAEILARLDPPADAQALTFLARYLAYRERGLALAFPDPDDTDLRARFERLRELRREMFGEDLALSLFEIEDAEAEVALRQREIAEDPHLSDEEKAALIEDLYEELPEPLREARNEALAAVRLREDEARLRADGAGEDEIRALRVERFGEEAADRLADLDREEAEWDSRMGDYRRERDRILGDPSLTPAARQAALEELRTGRFDERERIRVEALEQIEAEGE